MERIVITLIIVLGLLLALGFDASGLLGVLAFLYIFFSAFRLMLTRKFLDHFLATLIGIVIGPFFVCCLLRYLFGQLQLSLGSGLSSLILALLLLGLMITSFLYVRRQIRRLQHTEHEGHTNERRPLAPAHHDDEEEL